MSFPRYKKYKHSGVEWLGDLPASWEVLPIKRAFDVVGGSTPRSDNEQFWDGEIIWVTPADLSRLDSVEIRDSLRKITADGLASCGATLIPAGSIVLSTRAPIGSLGIAMTEMCTNQGCKALVPRRKESPTFMAYLLSVATTALNVRGKGTTFLELSGDELGAFPFVLPSHAERCAIAEFLGRETRKIDVLVAEQEKLIALLKEKRQALISQAITKGLDSAVPMKKSGVEWLGEVPTHWNVLKLGRLVFMQEGPGLRTWQFVDDGVRVICVTNITERGIDFSRLEKFITLEEYERSYLHFTVANGDVLLSSSGNSWGKVSVYREDRPVILNTSTMRLNENCTSDLLRDFIVLVLQSTNVREQLALAMTGACQPNFGPTHLKEVLVAVPPTSEQRKIIQSLDDRLVDLDGLIVEAERVIDLLKERRSALISAAVTGKIDVRGLMQQEAA